MLTSSFRLLTTASPARVWSVLTCPTTAPAFLHGLSPRTSWTPGAPVEWHACDAPAIPGQVLHADPPYRLSITVEDSSGPCTYLTWTLRTSDDGTVVRLDVEESGAAGSCETDLEDVWLPVLQRLGEVLREPVG